MTMPIPDGSVIITPRQMYDKLEETHKSVETLVATLPPALSDIRADAVALALKVEANETGRLAHGNRLTAIETKLNVAWGAIGALIAALATVAAWLGH